MNHSILAHLIKKDWDLYKVYVCIYIVLGAVSALLMTVPIHLVYYTGIVMLITVLIGASAHIAMAVVLTERKENQLSFLMGLPLRPIDYYQSKLLGGLAIYFVCWLSIIAFTLLVVNFSYLPNGFMPMVIICGLEILLATTIVLSVGLLTKGEAITIVTMVILNIVFNLFLFSVIQLPGIGSNIESETAVFGSSFFAVVSIELLLILLIVSGTLFIKSRKPCFF